MGGVRFDNISKPIIETKDKVNDPFACYDKAPKPDSSKFCVDTPVSINGVTFYGEYKLGQNTTLVDRKNGGWIKIDEKFKQELLSRAASAKAQDERIYKNEGIRIDFDEKTGNTLITRKM